MLHPTPRPTDHSSQPTFNIAEPASAAMATCHSHKASSDWTLSLFFPELSLATVRRFPVLSRHGRWDTPRVVCDGWPAGVTFALACHVPSFGVWRSSLPVLNALAHQIRFSLEIPLPAMQPLPAPGTASPVTLSRRSWTRSNGAPTLT